jgi:hypothetical protein
VIPVMRAFFIVICFVSFIRLRRVPYKGFTEQSQFFPQEKWKLQSKAN